MVIIRRVKVASHRHRNRLRRNMVTTTIMDDEVHHAISSCSGFHILSGGLARLYGFTLIQTFFGSIAFEVWENSQYGIYAYTLLNIYGPITWPPYNGDWSVNSQCDNLCVVFGWILMHYMLCSKDYKLMYKLQRPAHSYNCEINRQSNTFSVRLNNVLYKVLKPIELLYNKLSAQVRQWSKGVSSDVQDEINEKHKPYAYGLYAATARRTSSTVTTGEYEWASEEHQKQVIDNLNMNITDVARMDANTQSMYADPVTRNHAHDNSFLEEQLPRDFMILVKRHWTHANVTSIGNLGFIEQHSYEPFQTRAHKARIWLCQKILKEPCDPSWMPPRCALIMAAVCMGLAFSGKFVY